MADGAVTLKLDDYAATKLAAKAEALGISIEDLATSLVSSQLFDYDDFTWINGDPRDDHADNYDLKEPGRPWSEVRPELIARLNRKLAERG